MVNMFFHFAILYRMLGCINLPPILPWAFLVAREAIRCINVSYICVLIIISMIGSTIADIAMGLPAYSFSGLDFHPVQSY